MLKHTIFILLCFCGVLFYGSPLVAYGAPEPDCPVCHGNGWFFCDGEKEWIRHKVGDDTWYDEENGWSCGFCDGLGDYDPDYEEYRCKSCGYVGYESEYLICSRCKNIINQYNTMTHIRVCSCTGQIVPVTPAPELPVFYTVIYEGNNASGSMENSEHQVDVPQCLNSNEYYINFSVTYHTGNKDAIITTTSQNTGTSATFLGWAESVNGVPAYADEEVVTNLRLTEGSVWLYARWGPGSVVLPDAVCKEQGYQLAGWRRENGEIIPVRDTNGIFQSISYVVSQDETLTAVWEQKAYCVALDARGATSTGHTKEVRMHYGDVGPDILVPEKTGYIFSGYYTAVRGTGTQYYDEAGSCIQEWRETQVHVLYAYWIQEEVILPEEEPVPEPEVFPETVVEGCVRRTDSKALLYADDYNFATGALTDLQPYITYDTPGAGGAIPGTEQLAFRARMGSWILTYQFNRYAGTDTVNYIVSVPYRTQYELTDETLIISERKIKEYCIPVQKAWSYWTVEKIGMFYPEKVTITCDAFKEEQVTVTVQHGIESAVIPPEYVVTKYGDKGAHVIWPEYDADGVPICYITLEEEYIISDKLNVPPDTDTYLEIICKNAARQDNNEVKSRSDSMMFDGKVLLSDGWRKKDGAPLDETKIPSDESVELTSYLQTYLSGMEQKEENPNGTYAASAVITYAGDDKNIGTAHTMEEVLTDINNVNVHTPVACDGVLVDGMEDGVLVLKDALNFFTLRIDNTGTHRMNLGYGEKDFTFALSGKSNIAKQNDELVNRVKFPFDVYMDVNNNTKQKDGTYETSDDFCVKAGEWLTMDKRCQTFYIPVTQTNGTYQIQFQTIAVNCPKEGTEYRTESVTQMRANQEQSNYVAEDVLEIVIKSYIKDFKITATDDPYARKKWKEGKQALTLKAGYEFSYEIVSQGEFYGENTEWLITPEFFWVSEDGSRRLEAELYTRGYDSEKEQRECFAWEGIHFLENQEHYDVILQRFYGTGRIPQNILCVPKNMKEKYGFSLEEYLEEHTITGREEFFLHTGYLMIHLDIKIKSEEGRWYLFNQWENTELYKDAVSDGWFFLPGDIIRYDLSSGVADDYEIGGLE